MFEIRNETARDGLVADIEGKLLNSLRDAQEQGQNSHLILSIRDKNGALIAGLVASTSYGWLLVKMLWVDDAYRLSGYGKALMLRAGDVAKGRDCHSVWLETSSPESYKFYISLGFEIFGVLENCDGQVPPDHQRWFMKRRLITP